MIHVEGLWAENAQTAEGRVLHERARQAASETVDGVRVARHLRLCCRELGLSGVANVVEFHPVAALTPGPSPAAGEGSNLPDPSPATGEESAAGVALAGLPGRWRPYPVEYKRGRKKPEMSYFVPDSAPRPCAWKRCWQRPCPAGPCTMARVAAAQEVVFDDALRARTRQRADELHALMAAGSVPPPQPGPKCRFCSLADTCVPKLAQSRSARAYLARTLEAILSEEE